MKYILTLLSVIAIGFLSCDNDDEMNVCNKPEACTLSPDPGPCEAYIPKYFYNQETEQCEEFIWGGCDGVVPFDTMEECEVCIENESPNNCQQPEACSLTPDPGPCFAYIPKYFYNQETEQCEEFIWGGCDGIVPFDTMEECEVCLCNGDKMSQEQEFEHLNQMFNEIENLSLSVNCNNSSEWSFIGYGSKACGGHVGYIAYSININIELFFQKINDHKIAQQEYNQKWGIISDCSIPPQPNSVICEDGNPVFIY